MKQDLGSFRDRSGYVYSDPISIIRTIMPCYKETWQLVKRSGLLDEVVNEKLLIPFEECPPIAGSWKSLNVNRIPFISYPYEWSFSQLQDAALLTLKLQLKALSKGLTLKDASAYNIQFIGEHPVFIDILSFEEWEEGQPWEAYGQFCSHFLAPLALAAKKDLRLSQLSRQWIDGIPLDIASSMLPWKSKLSLGTYMHLVLHANMQKKYEDPRSVKKNNTRSMSLEKLRSIIESLESTTKKFVFPRQDTEWGDYYNDTNYTDEGTSAKLKIVEEIAANFPGNLAVDLGANTGRFSLPLANYFDQVISADMDPAAVEFNYRHLSKNGPHNILPVILDLSSPSPSLGWASQERKSFVDRCEADMLLALALCHHLFFSSGIPFKQIAMFFASLLNPQGTLVCEFIPKKDSQVQRLLSARDDVFDDYTEENFRQDFNAAGFTEVKTFDMPDSVRTIYLFKKSN
ncbi:hypothetical protein [Maridesulfovibrio sp.]|uniref:hypothetical protein n=1 Tax=Maridesulfovibrio sp. TaxID=2795000 RepID=UPI002A18858F|nr:hypothetical protein [Maridesulfovibrio sp.]